MYVSRPARPSAEAILRCMFLLLIYNVMFLNSAAADIVAYWRFEEGTADSTATGDLSILDSSGRQLHGTPYGGPVYRSVSQPVSSLAFEFDGVDDRVFVADDPLFQLTRSLTLEALVRVDEFGVNREVVFRGDNRGGLDPYQLAITAGGQLAFTIDNAANVRTRLLSPDVLPLGELVHVAGTLDDVTGDMKLYINGSLVSETNTVQRPFGPLDPNQSPGIGIGSLNSSEQMLFKGLIDEVRISDTALGPGSFVPEPCSLWLWGMAAVSLGIVVYRVRNRNG